MTTTKALEGVTVLDLSHLLQVPFATQLLADLGANVIKVERPGQGDLFRTLTFNNRWVGGRESPNFLAWNRNKRSLALDLKRLEAATTLYRLAARADVGLQNSPPCVLAQLGIGYGGFRRVNPRIIYCSAYAFGAKGRGLPPAAEEMVNT